LKGDGREGYAPGLNRFLHGRAISEMKDPDDEPVSRFIDIERDRARKPEHRCKGQLPLKQLVERVCRRLNTGCGTESAVAHHLRERLLRQGEARKVGQ
jgi:hypothetical protein